jgi:hypothetical protein
MDLLHFDPQPLYFDEPLPDAVRELIEEAGLAYGEPRAQTLLQQAAALAPDHLVVLVALYRYHFYQHDLDTATAVAQRVIAHVGARLGLPEDGRDVGAAGVAAAAAQSMTLTRFYLSALKALAYLRLRRGDTAEAVRLLETLLAVDAADRLGGRALLDIAHARQAELAASAP